MPKKHKKKTRAQKIAESKKATQKPAAPAPDPRPGLNG